MKFLINLCIYFFSFIFSKFMIKKKFIEDLRLEGLKVLTRLDLNVPINKNSGIIDNTRIKSSLKTIRYIIENGGKAVLISHLGRPDGQRVRSLSLKPIANELTKSLGKNVILAPDCIGEEVEKIVNRMKNGDVVLLENLRFHKAETNNEKDFCKKLSKLGDVFINDAFGVAHRSHASTAGVSKFILNSAIGYLIQKELHFLGKIVSNPVEPFLAILGGAKVADKIGVIDKLLDKVQTLIIGGGMSCTFLKAQGFDIGNSLLEKDLLQFAREMIQKSKKKRVELLLPNDAKIANSFENNALTRTIKLTEGVPKGWMILDIGKSTSDLFCKVVANSKTILWNGPMGVFEMEKFCNGTFAIARSLAGETARGALTIIGGGDSVAAINEYGLSKNITHISTGGGATLKFLEGNSLPGVISIVDA